MITRQLREIHMFPATPPPKSSRRFGETDPEVLQTYSVSPCRPVNERFLFICFRRDFWVSQGPNNPTKRYIDKFRSTYKPKSINISFSWVCWGFGFVLFCAGLVVDGMN